MWAGMTTFSSENDAAPHRAITDAVHAEGGLIAMQILHAGRYAKHPDGVAPSAIKSPLSAATPRAMSEDDIERTISDYANAARLAADVGYDGVEIMGAEGYLINQFMAPRANRRTDRWGGSPENRMRFGVETVRRVRARGPSRFILIFRLSMLDLVEEGSTWDEVVMFAKAVEEAGVSIINPYVGWHESRIPTIATMVPRAAFVALTARLKRSLRVPVVASNRINDPAIAEGILSRNEADLISMSRPFLADPDFVNKAISGRAAEINTCIACNQACLDRTFRRQVSSCMVNPVAGHETELAVIPARKPRRVAVVGAGPAGLACAATAAERGHDVTLFEADREIGGQFNLARRIPGKEEFAETLRYFTNRLAKAGVNVQLGRRMDAPELLARGFQEVVLATGVTPRTPMLNGVDHSKVATYVEIIKGLRIAGPKVAIIGAGGVGFDVAELLTHPGESALGSIEGFASIWGIDFSVRARGGLQESAGERPVRDVWLLQRKAGRPGADLAKTTGWIRRGVLARRGVQMVAEVEYERIDDGGLHFRIAGRPCSLAVDTVVLCAGQEPLRDLEANLKAAGATVSLIGGAKYAVELDAVRAIDEGVRLAASL
jgi:2,4-dienoyl-CoA reductase (NADPH2)